MVQKPSTWTQEEVDKLSKDDLIHYKHDIFTGTRKTALVKTALEKRGHKESAEDFHSKKTREWTGIIISGLLGLAGLVLSIINLIINK